MGKKKQYNDRMSFDEAEFYNVNIFFKTASKFWQQWFRGENDSGQVLFMDSFPFPPRPFAMKTNILPLTKASDADTVIPSQ